MGRGRKARNPNRGRKTTAEDLDADMADYFQTTENGGQGEGNAQVNGAQQGGGEDLGMAEISVSSERWRENAANVSSNGRDTRAVVLLRGFGIVLWICVFRDAMYLIRLEWDFSALR